MKRNGPDHPKMDALMEALDLARYEAVGLVELLFHFASKFCPKGNVGRWDDLRIARSLSWRGRPEDLIAALELAGWLDPDATHRYLIHDWPAHCEDSIHAMLKRRGESFADGSLPYDRLRAKSRAAKNRLRTGSLPFGPPSGDGQGPVCPDTKNHDVGTQVDVTALCPLPFASCHSLSPASGEARLGTMSAERERESEKRTARDIHDMGIRRVPERSRSSSGGSRQMGQDVAPEPREALISPVWKHIVRGWTRTFGAPPTYRPPPELMAGLQRTMEALDECGPPAFELVAKYFKQARSVRHRTAWVLFEKGFLDLILPKALEEASRVRIEHETERRYRAAMMKHRAAAEAARADGGRAKLRLPPDKSKIERAVKEEFTRARTSTIHPS